MKKFENKSKNKKQKSHRFFDVSSKIQRSSNLLFPLQARGLEGIKYFLNICTCFYAQNYLIRRSLEFFRILRKNRNDFLGFGFAKMLALALVLSLGVISEARAACNGATATTAGTDEENQPCGSWDCGATGSNVTCTLSKGTLTISGEGSMKDYFWVATNTAYPKRYKTDAPWGGTRLTKANIEGNVTKIGDSAFLGESYLTEISGTESLKTIGSWGFEYSGIKSIDISNVTTLDWSAFNEATDLQYINMRDDVYFRDSRGYGRNQGTLKREAFSGINIINSCVTNPETGIKTCGSCGDKYVKSGTGCVTEENCGAGYYADEASKKCLYCPQDKVVYKGQCLDEYPFAKKHWTPAEAAQWLNEDNNTVTLTFKK